MSRGGSSWQDAEGKKEAVISHTIGADIISTDRSYYTYMYMHMCVSFRLCDNLLVCLIAIVYIY